MIFCVKPERIRQIEKRIEKEIESELGASQIKQVSTVWSLGSQDELAHFPLSPLPNKQGLKTQHIR